MNKIPSSSLFTKGAKIRKKGILIMLLGLLTMFTMQLRASDDSVRLDRIHNDLCDDASLQRGARMYVNYCMGCHSLQFVRFKGMAQGIGIVDKKGDVLEKLVNENLNFISDKINDTMKIAMPNEDAKKWFGNPPPDLSLGVRLRGKNWIYTYLRSFYEDPKKQWGMNNLVFPDVGMPNVFQELQGTQVPVFKQVTLTDDQGKPYEKEVIDHLELKSKGTMTEQEFNSAIRDLVNFLDYVGEPHKMDRKRMGVWVILFLVIFTLFAYLLKREYWKDVH